MKHFSLSLLLVLVCVTTPLEASSLSVAQIQGELERGDGASAELHARQMLSVQPRDPLLLKLLGAASDLQGKSLDAVAALQQIPEGARDADTLALLAVNHCRMRQYELALHEMDAVQHKSAEPAVLARLAPCYLEAGEPLHAAEIYTLLGRSKYLAEDELASQLVRCFFDASRKLLRALMLQHSGAPYSEAVQAAAQDSTADAKKLFPRAFEAAPYMRASDDIDTLNQLLPTHKNAPELLYVLGVMCAEHANDLFETALQQWPDSVAIRRVKAELLAFNNDLSGAIEEYQAILASHPDAPVAINYALGNMYAGKLQWEEALAQYRIVQGRQPNDLIVIQRLSECYGNLSDYDRQFKAVEPIARRPDAPFWALRDAGSAAANEQKYQLAIGFLQRAEVSSPNDNSIHFRLATAYRKVGELSLARHESELFKNVSHNAHKD